mmetsp:Transcript_59417/g.141716  ORF Transcript_59417/g.141716 Transcript_59417/m.141716 type:complete len:278 (+) Transcript_59417:19-852(+)
MSLSVPAITVPASWKSGSAGFGINCFRNGACVHRGTRSRLGPLPLWGGLAFVVLPASQVCRQHCRRSRGSAKACSNGDDKFLRGKAIMEELRKKAVEDMTRRETPGWEAELMKQFQTDETMQEFDVKEATSMGDVWGASQLLSQQDAAEFEGRNQAESDVNPFLGLGFMRVYSSLSSDAPLTAIATSRDGVLGMAQVKKDGYVQNLVVQPEARRRGVATQIICWCAAKSRLRGARQLWMHVESGNQAALNFYKRLGFEVVCEELYRDRLAVRLSKEL